MRVLGALAAATVALTVVVPVIDRSGPLAAREAAASDAAASLVGLINDARQRQGLGSLSVAGDLESLAAERARIMADAGALSHTPDLGNRVCCWTWVGENVGYAYSVPQTHDMFMGSAPHRANILAPQATDVGVAVVDLNGTLWVAEVFRARAGGDSSRTADASQSSRSGDREATAGGGGSEPSSAGTTASTASRTSGVTESTGTARSVTLAERLHTLRAALRQQLQERGRLDPLLAAVRYSATLDRVNR